MPARVTQLLVWLLCFAVGGVAHAALCRAGSRPPRDHACCRPAETPTPRERGNPEQPCDRCTLLPATPATQKPSHGVASDRLSRFDTPIIENQFAAFALWESHLATDDLPVPPLLRDLHHLSCQLTE